MLFGLFFLLGIFTNSLGHILLQIKPMYKFWKLAELGALKVLAEAEMLHYQSLAILELSYKEVNKEEEFNTIKEKIINKHEEQQNRLITLMCNILPYKTNYSTPKEAFKAIEQIIKQGEEADE